MSLLHLYNATMSVDRVTETQSPTGGLVEHKERVHTDIPCLLEQVSGGEREIFGREGVVYTHNLFCDLLALFEKDEIEINGKTYDMIWVDDPQSRAHHMENMVKERR